MLECGIEIAGVSALIRCRYQRNVDFFRDYLSSLPPRFVIEPAEADLERMQADYDRMDAAEGLRPRRRREDYLENSAIHSLLAEKMVQENVLLMHGSALCMDGQAYIFTARSGTGKSTHARLWREAFGDRVWMINDDKPMLRIGEAGAAVYGTPWNGKHHLGRNASAPLKAIVKLERDKVNRIEPLSKADAFPILMRQALGSKKPAVMARIVEMENRLLRTVDFYSLGCNMLPEAAITAWEGMNSINRVGEE